MHNAHDYYSILDVPRTASDAEIRRAFRALAKVHHPDSHASGRGRSAERDFRVITEAYETLKDKRRRAAYDRELDEARQLEAQAQRPGKRSFMAGLGVGFLSAIMAVAAVAYFGADRTAQDKSQDSLTGALNAEEAEESSTPREGTKVRDAVAAADPSSSTGPEKAPPSPAPAQSGPAAPAPIQVSSKSPADSQAPSNAPAGSGKTNDKSFQNAGPAPAEAMEIVAGLPGHKKTVRMQPGKGLTQSFSDCKSCPEMIVVPAGEGLVGSRREGSPHAEETPAHRVRLAKPIAISKSVISAGNWRACVDAGVCRLTLTSLLAAGPRVAATRLSWADAKTYADWLSQATGARYRLLSEAEWEYAARAGKGRGPMEAEAGRYATDTSGLFPRVRFGRLTAGPNAWGVQGGGVLEWVEDCWHGSYDHAPDDASPWLSGSGGDCDYRVVRGSANAGSGLGWNPSARAKAFADSKAPTLGFRVAREIAAPARTALDANGHSRREP